MDEDIEVEEAAGVVDATASQAADEREDAEVAQELAESEEDDDSEDSLTYSNGVIEKIVAMATREVPHVLGMKGQPHAPGAGDVRRREPV